MPRRTLAPPSAARSTPADAHVNHEPPSRSFHLVGFAIVAAAWAFCATRAIELPGVYMDAVNPDYLVARVLNWRREPMTAWVLPGNYLLGARFPILVSLYHGSQHFWLGLPLFWLLGTTVESLRIVHALFGLGVLAALYALLASPACGPGSRRSRPARWRSIRCSCSRSAPRATSRCRRRRGSCSRCSSCCARSATMPPPVRSSPAAFSPASRCRDTSSTPSTCRCSSPACGSGRRHGPARGEPGGTSCAGASVSCSASPDTCSATR